MTRINVVPVQELENMHLLAEYRELPRIFQLAKNFYASGKKEDLPSAYTLGKGHVKFFYNKLTWLEKRQVQIIEEMKKRGYNPQFSSPKDLLKDCPVKSLGDYDVTEQALEINRERIAVRLKESEEKKMKKKSNFLKQS